MKKAVKRLFAATSALLCAAILFAGCAAGGAEGGLKSEKGEKTVPRRADYASGDVEYSVTVEDGERVVCLDVTRSGGISVATVSAPEELYGLLITNDIEGVRLFPAESDAELTMSAEAAEGLCVIFEVMGRELSDAEYTTDGCFDVVIGGFDVCVKLDESGYPREAQIKRDGVTRAIKYEMREGN